MGQVLLVQGEEPEAVAALYQKACELFWSLHGVRPAHGGVVGKNAFARFPPWFGRSVGYHREGVSWAGSAGTWIHPEGDEQEGLAEISRAFSRGAGLPEAARRFEGYFLLLAGGDATTDTAVVTDRLGALHAYQTRVGRCLALSTSALVLAALRDSGLDPESAREILCTGSVFGRRSLFEGVEKLAAGSIHTLRDGQVVSRETWFDLRSILYGASPSQGDAAGLADSLLQAMEAIFRFYPRPLLDLTGGIDTRNILAAARRLGRDVTTAVNGFDGDSDVLLANNVARALNLDHRHRVPGRDYRCASYEDLVRASALCDGEYNVLKYAPVAAIQERTAEEFDLSVSGTFGEFYQGAGWYTLLSDLEARGELDSRRLVRLRFVENPWADRLTKGRFADSLTEHFCGVTVQVTEGLKDLPLAAQADAMEVFQWARRSGRVASSTTRILPCLSPFSFGRFLHIALSAPPALRFGGRMALALAGHLDPGLLSLPLKAGFSCQPHALSGLRRRVAEALLGNGGHLIGVLAKTLYPRRLPGAMSGLDIWSLPEIQDLLRPESMLTRDLYDEPFLRSFLKMGQSRRLDPASMLGRVLSLEIAARTLRDKPFRG